MEAMLWLPSSLRMCVLDMEKRTWRADRYFYGLAECTEQGENFMQGMHISMAAA